MTAPVSSLSAPAASERLIVFLVGAVQFVNILDFVMVMPLGPDFARALGVPVADLGYVGGAYTAAAAVSGLIGSFFLDRLDRRPALVAAMLGLVAGTAAGGLATGLATLLAARVIAGLFGGPATSLAFSIIADVIPVERRGKAMGAVMGAFSAATVLGVPAGLELARLGGWRMPFFAVAGLGLAITLAVGWALPPLRGHLRGVGVGGTPLGALLSRPIVLSSYAMTATVMMSGFIVIPNISPYVQENLRFPREHLGSLYLFGGIVSFFATRFGGRLVDRFGSFKTGTFGASLLFLVLYVFFYDHRPWIPVAAFFMAFMLAMGLRNVAYNTLTSKVPRPDERARFQSIQSAVQHAASAAGAFLAARMLTVRPDGTLDGVDRAALVAMALTVLVPVLLWWVERRVAAARAR